MTIKLFENLPTYDYTKEKQYSIIEDFYKELTCHIEIMLKTAFKIRKWSYETLKPIEMQKYIMPNGSQEWRYAGVPLLTMTPVSEGFSILIKLSLFKPIENESSQHTEWSPLE